MAQSLAGAAALVLLLAVAEAVNVAPCVQGKPATSIVELARDDWVCVMLCAFKPVTAWDATCRRCCPKWLGGDGANGQNPSSESTTTAASTAEGTKTTLSQEGAKSTTSEDGTASTTASTTTATASSSSEAASE